MARSVGVTSAARSLAEHDAIIAELIRVVGMPRLRAPQESHFSALVRAVVYQQLAGNAAKAIHTRLIAAVDGEVSPSQILATPFEALRAAGLSQNKALSITDLAQKMADGNVLLEPRRLARIDDDEIVAMLSTVRGVGRWTAQMFLIFQLRRLDVWPAGDLGVRRGFGLGWNVPMPKERELEPLGDQFRPFRSIAAWYCWRACEIYAQVGKSALTG